MYIHAVKHSKHLLQSVFSHVPIAPFFVTFYAKKTIKYFCGGLIIIVDYVKFSTGNRVCVLRSAFIQDQSDRKNVRKNVKMC